MTLLYMLKLELQQSELGKLFPIKLLEINCLKLFKVPQNRTPNLSPAMQLAGKIFGDADTAMPVIKQLAFENANKYCKEALRAHKDKSLNDMIRLCRDIDGNISLDKFWQLPFDRDLVEIQGLDQRCPDGTLECILSSLMCPDVTPDYISK
ncbi:hypothetical protein STEG23_037054 [Scotinomys teguina]